jgi:hypothetical protein
MDCSLPRLRWLTRGLPDLEEVYRGIKVGFAAG